MSRCFAERAGLALPGLFADLFQSILAVMVDGVHFAESGCVVAPGIAGGGTSVALGLVEGATENATVVRYLPGGTARWRCAG